MVNISIDQFKSRFSGGARNTLFRVSVANFPASVPGGRDRLTFMTKAASLPPSVLGMIEVPYLGRKLKIAGDRTFDAWTITVINDEDFMVRDSFEKWSNAINAHYKNTSAFSNPSQYMADFTVEQLGRDGNVLKAIKVKDAWPTNIGEIELNWESNDQIEEFTVEINYFSWEWAKGQNGATTDRASGSSGIEVDIGINLPGLGGLGL